MPLFGHRSKTVKILLMKKDKINLENFTSNIKETTQKEEKKMQKKKVRVDWSSCKLKCSVDQFYEN